MDNYTNEVTTVAESQLQTQLQGAALRAWQGYLRSHAAILRELDAELLAGQGLTTRDYEVLLILGQAPERRLPMSALAESTMLTRSGITRLVDGLVREELIERVACPSDARVSHAVLTETGLAKLRRAGTGHVAAVERLFLTHFSAEELEHLAELLGRLPGSGAAGACTVQ